MFPCRKQHLVGHVENLLTLNLLLQGKVEFQKKWPQQLKEGFYEINSTMLLFVSFIVISGEGCYCRIY
jgi:hypothetical protein